MKNNKVHQGYTIVEVLTALVLFSLCIIITTSFFQLIQSSTLVKSDEVYQLAVNKMEKLLSEKLIPNSSTETVDRWIINSKIIEDNGLFNISVKVLKTKNQRLLYCLTTYKCRQISHEYEE